MLAVSGARALSPLLLVVLAALVAAPAARAADGDQAAPSFDAVGAEDAKVKVDQLLDFGIECQWDNVRILRAVAKALPSKFRVVFIDTATEEGQAKAKEKGVTCKAQLLINGAKELTVERHGKATKIQIHGPFSLSKPADVSSALVVALRQADGEVKPADAKKIQRIVADGFAHMKKTSHG